MGKSETLARMGRSLAMAVLATCGAAYAQEMPGFGPLDRIVVTARRAGPAPLDAPLSIDVLGQTRISGGQVRSTYDLQFAVPGLTTTANAAFAQLYMRGVGGDLISIGGDATVSTFVDGVYQARAALGLQDVFDVERIEILKGPHGALYGRNVVAGAVHVVSARPTMSPAAAARIEIGNFRQRRLTGAISGPLVADAAALRLSVMSSKNRGFLRNQARGERTDRDDVSAFRVQGLFRPSDALEVVVRADVSGNEGSRFLAQKPVPPFTDNPALGFAGAPAADPRTVSLDTSPQMDLRSAGGGIDTVWRGAKGEFRSLTSWRDVRLDQIADLDGTALPFATAADDERSQVFT